MNKHRGILRHVWLLVLLVALTACVVPGFSGTGTQQKIEIESAVLSTTHARPVPVGVEMVIISAHTDPDGVRNVEFFIDGNRISNENPPFGQTYFQIEHKWTPPKSGEYKAKIVAHSYAEKDPDSVEFIITASDDVLAVVTEPLRPAEALGTPTPTTAFGDQIACSNQAQFITDVAIPDGTVLQPGTQFNKIWRVRNTGTCNWSGNYYIDWVGGSAMGGTRQPLPPVNVGQETDITVPMTAPSQAGSYRGDWRLHDREGLQFGSTLYVQINVPGSATCKPVPVIKSFTASPTSIAPEQSSTLSWVVEGASQVKITPTAQASSTSYNLSNSLVVYPNTTTTYTLEATNGNCSTTAQVTVTVSGGGPTCDSMVIHRFDANPATIQRGQTSTLTWDVTGATEISVSPQQTSGVSTASSSMTVSPQQTTNYVLTAKNSICTKTNQTTVNVVQESVLLDFVQSAPSAVWRTNTMSIPWFGTIEDYPGYARWASNITLQNGQFVPQALEVRPGADAYVQGVYNFSASGGVQRTDKLLLKLGYEQGAYTSSGASYSVKFAPVGGGVINVTSVTVDPNGALTEISLPLDMIPAGQQGQFMVQVDKGSNPSGNTAVWVEAKIIRP